MPSSVSVLLVDDHPVVLYGLQAICATDDAIEVVGEATSSAEAMRATTELRPDVAVVPIRLGGTRAGIELCRGITDVAHTRVVVFTSFTRAVDVEVAALAGASALVGKSAPPEALLRAIHQASRGERTVVLGPGNTAGGAADRFRLSGPLTGREQEILGLVLEGRTNAAIAEHLVIEVSTVKTHMRSLLRKLGVGNRRDLL